MTVWVETPVFLRRPARMLAGLLVLLAAGLVFAPWQQTAPGAGKVVAYAPVDREQVIEAPVKGRIVRWFVQEGSTVAKGDPLVELMDIDPGYVTRLETRRVAVLETLAAAQEQAGAYQAQEAAYEEARRLTLEAAAQKVQMARQKVKAARQKVEAEQANLQTVTLNLERVKKLYAEGLSSKRDVELAELAYAKAETALNGEQAALAEAEAQIAGLESERLQKGAEALAKITSARAAHRKASAEEAKAKSELAKAEVDLARQSSRRVLAPRAGTVLSLSGNQGGAVVKEGDRLAVLVPETESRAVELWVDGNDAPLITPGRKVRLQFEGWPAVQFAGWPSVAVGTFGAQVALVDVTSTPDGRFRVLVVPDAADAPWPEPRFLRQGVRAKGWVLLDEVRLGYELWRQLNGFPATVTPPDGAKGGAKNGAKEKGK
ncbi:MAG: HlyD family efflux transporter periplasmic adaptor subunit [Deltaproteobacteria bacterium]|nr:HlyD family efflux transporter periplasmic adaptor subunit [Deltaproteobacteria bacterium]